MTDQTEDKDIKYEEISSEDKERYSTSSVLI